MPYMFEYSDEKNVPENDLLKVISWLQNQHENQSRELERVVEKIERLSSELVPSKKKKIMNSIMKGLFTTALAVLG